MSELKEIVQNISTSSKDTKNNTTTEQRCISAIKITTIKGAWKLIDKGVILVPEEVNGVIKSVPYTQCNKNHLPGDKLCHIHNTQKKDINRNNPVIFKDILPDDNDDNNDTISRKKNYRATGNEEYFKKINRKGVPEKKNNTSTLYDFKDIENPILICIKESPEILQELLLSAIKLLQDNNIKITNNILNKNNKKTEEKKSKSHNNSLLNTINALNDLNDLNNSPKNEDKNISTKNPSLLNNILLSTDNKIEEDIEEEDIEEDDIEEEDIEEEDIDEEETECIEIYTNERVLLALDINTNIVYKPEDDDNYVELGKLTKINEKYSTIEHDYQNWTIFKDIKCPETDNNLKLCALTNKVFNTDLAEPIGKVTKKKDLSYKITIFKKKK